MIVGVDVGGTFTDIVIVNDNKVEVKKVLTDIKEPWKPLKDVIQWKKVREFIHATTLGTNLFLGQENLELPSVLLITDDNFEDIIEIGRQNRPEVYNMFFTRPRPLVSRDKRIGVSHINKISCEEVIVIALLNCFKDKREKEYYDIVKERCKNSIVVRSCEVDPSIGEYERFSTAIINGILKKTLSEYVDKLTSSINEWGFKGKFYMMNSSGGISEVNDVLERPAMFIESGPASGVIASANLLRELGKYNGISFDMGGTTAKASLIINGEPFTTDYFEVGGKYHMGTLIRGSGYPLRIPHVDLVEVSAGGGTIIWVDKGGALRVGPKSVGSNPGPACYGIGEVPAITDANLVLGRLPSRISSLKLNKSRAIDALKNVAKKLGRHYIDVAIDAIHLINEEMSRSVRLVSVNRGWDPSQMVLVAFGGAGPQHALEMAELIDIEEVVIPFHAGVFSAFGLVTADFKKEITITIERKLKDEELEELIQKEINKMKKFDTKYVIVEVAFKGQMRGKEYTYTKDIYQRYVEEFKKEYGFVPNAEVIVKRIRVIGIRRRRKVYVEEKVGEYCCERDVYDNGWVRAPVYRGIPEVVEGTAVIETETTTIFVPKGWRGVRKKVGMVFSRVS